MKIGLPLSLPYDELPEFARCAEAIGIESLWTYDHLVWPAHRGDTYPYTEGGRPPVPSDLRLHDPWVLLGSIAAITSRVRLGTSVYVLPLRNLFVTARGIATLDVLSHGRAILGAGVGWLKEEFDVAGQDFSARGKRADDITAALRRLWGDDDPVAFRGDHVAFPPVHFHPTPPQGAALPIMFGGESRPALERAGRIGDGWIGMRHSPESAAERIAELDRVRTAAGRTDRPFEVTVGAPWPLSLAQVAAYEDAGVHRISVRPWSRDGGNWMAGLEMLADLISDP